MKKQYKIVLNLVIEDPEKPFPAGGDYTHLNRVNGILHYLLAYANEVRSIVYNVSLDKVIDKGAIQEDGLANRTE